MLVSLPSKERYCVSKTDFWSVISFKAASSSASLDDEDTAAAGAATLDETSLDFGVLRMPLEVDALGEAVGV